MIAALFTIGLVCLALAAFLRRTNRLLDAAHNDAAIAKIHAARLKRQHLDAQLSAWADSDMGAGERLR